MPVLVQGDALSLISEIDTAIQVDLLRGQGETGRQNRLLWADNGSKIATVTREFVSICLEDRDGDSAAA